MVHGLEKFRAYFEDLTSQYVIIGGTACDILMDELGAAFRATRDLDMVLILEALDPSFGVIFWQFIEDGGYEHRQKGTGKNQFYRFSEPRDPSFPSMIELFTRLPDHYELSPDAALTPIHIDDQIQSLSAILLDDAYYDLLIKGKLIIDGVSLIRIETVILFKVKAWLDMKERFESGEPIDTKNIRKHKNDVFRLLANVSPAIRLELPGEIQADVSSFIHQIRQDPPELKNLGIRRVSLDEMLETLAAIFSGQADAEGRFEAILRSGKSQFHPKTGETGFRRIG